MTTVIYSRYREDRLRLEHEVDTAQHQYCEMSRQRVTAYNLPIETTTSRKPTIYNTRIGLYRKLLINAELNAGLL